MPGDEHVHSGAGVFLRATSDGGGRPARGAGRRAVQVFGVPSHPPELRPHDGVLRRAPAAVLDAGDGGFPRFRAARGDPRRPAPLHRPRGRRPLHTLRRGVLLHRHRAFRHRDARRVRRAHLPGSPTAPPVPDRGDPGDRGPPAVTSAVVFAYHNVGVRCLSVLLARGVDVRLVLTHEDSPGENIWFDSVRDRALENGVPTEAPADPNLDEVLERVRACEPDFLFSFYYRQMLKRPLLASARRGAYNVHGSLLPKYRGRVPINWAIIHGETETGATLHAMTEKPDAGDIVDQTTVPGAPALTVENGGLVARCKDGSLLAVLDAELNGGRLDAETLTAKHGGRLVLPEGAE